MHWLGAMWQQAITYQAINDFCIYDQMQGNTQEYSSKISLCCHDIEKQVGVTRNLVYKDMFTHQ